MDLVPRVETVGRLLIVVVVLAGCIPIVALESGKAITKLGCGRPDE